MSVQNNEIATFYPENKEAWRRWLQYNHNNAKGVWLVQYKKNTNIPSISWSEAVDVALCFGWIDSRKKALDKEKFVQFFSKRKASGTWSKVNKDKIEILLAQGLMTEAGLASVALAKQNGSWNILDEVEALTIPLDLADAFAQNPAAKAYFEGLSKSVKKAMLQGLVLAKKAETRQKRISELVDLANQNLKPKHIY